MSVQAIATETNSLPGHERRQSVRHSLLTLRAAKLRCLSGEYICIIHDVSETGTKLRLFHEHPPETFMFLELPDGELYPVERRWTRDEFAGFRFASAIDVDDILNPRGPKAHNPVTLTVERPAAVTIEGETRPAVLVDLSSQGACISVEDHLPVRARIQLELPGVLSRLAYVSWRRDHLHEIAFQEPFALKDLAQLALDLQPYKSEPSIAAV